MPVEALGIEKTGELAELAAARGIGDLVHQPLHRLDVAGGGFLARGIHAGLGDHGEVDLVAGLLREVVHELALDAAIALPERVDGVEIGEDPGALLRETGARQAAQVVRAGDAGREARHLRLDPLGLGEAHSTAGLAHAAHRVGGNPVDLGAVGAERPRPVEDVLEDMGVEGAEMVRVECPGGVRALLAHLGDAIAGAPRHGRVEALGIVLDAEPVLQREAVGLQIGVGCEEGHGL